MNGRLSLAPSLCPQRAAGLDGNHVTSHKTALRPKGALMFEMDRCVPMGKRGFTGLADLLDWWK